MHHDDQLHRASALLGRRVCSKIAQRSSPQTIRKWRPRTQQKSGGAVVSSSAAVHGRKRVGATTEGKRQRFGEIKRERC